MTTDIIVPTFGQEVHTCRCFESIARHTRDYRLVWLDNGSTAESRGAVMPAFERSKKRLSVWCGSNLGFVAGVNTALAIVLDHLPSDCKYVVLQNNDTVVTSGWLGRMIRVLERDKRVAAVGPVTAHRGPSLQSWEGALSVAQRPDYDSMSVDQRAEHLWRVNGDRYEHTGVVTFFCTVFRRSVFEEIGRLDPEYGVGLWDDHDLCVRIRKAGLTPAVALGAYVFHNHRTTFKAVMSAEEIEQEKQKNRAVFLSKHGSA